MAVLDPIVDFIKQADEKELYTYLGVFAGVFLVLFGLLVYYHWSQVSWYQTQLRKLDKERSTTRTILQDTLLVKAQQQQVEDILTQDKDFIIGQAYKSIIQQSQLASREVNRSTPRTGESISGKTEVQISSILKGLTMKEVTDFLLAIAKVPQLYTKDITIKKNAGRPTVDVDITVATLEPSLE
jgi:hypothetical protein